MDDETRRKRARFRAWHRGMREADLILGSFADRHIDGLDAGELAEFETLLEVPDGDFIRWVTGEASPPPERDTPLMRRIADYRRAEAG